MHKTTILFLDDEERIVRILGVLFKAEEKYTVLTSTSVKDALDLFDDNEIHIVVSDQRMPEMKGVEFLSKVQKKSPNTIRILLTGYADLDAIIGSINEGEVYRYISKPWENKDLLETVDKASKLADLVFKSAKKPAVVKQKHKVEKVASTSSTDDYGILVLDSGTNKVSKLIKGFYINNPVYTISKVQQISTLLAKAARSNKDISIVVAELDDDRNELVSTVKAIKKANPVVLCIVITAYADAEVAITLINEGQIYRYLSIPINPGRLKMSIASALSYAEQLKNNSNHIKWYEADKKKDIEGDSFMKKVESLFSVIKKRIFG